MECECYFLFSVKISTLAPMVLHQYDDIKAKHQASFAATFSWWKRLGPMSSDLTDPAKCRNPPRFDSWEFITGICS